MYWRVISPRDGRFRGIYGDNMPYGPQEFLELSDEIDEIDPRKLRFFASDDPGEDRKPVPDLSYSINGVLVMTPRSFLVLQPLFASIKFKTYPGKLDDGSNCIVFCCLTEVSGFDFDRSKFEIFDDGDIIRVFDLKIVDGFTTNYNIFRLADNWGPRFELVVSDRFFELCKRHNLTGLDFLPT